VDAARYRELKRILFEAQRREGRERATYLAAACAGDDALRAEVESLLARTEVPTGDLAAPIVESLHPPPPRRCGPYEVGGEVGRGGMGVVYEARDVRDGRRVAIKVLPPNFARSPRLFERFQREARMGLKVDHENVVRTLDVGEVEAEPGGTCRFLVMEYVEGRTLRELAADLGTVPEAFLREIGAQVAAGLAAIHAAGIVHRDLKPENILISDDQRVRIMDLGVAKLQEASVELTHEGQFLGSLAYAAPEQCDGRAVGPAADLYALGVVLYELTTGLNPFRHENPGAVIRAQLDLIPPPASAYEADVSPFLSETLAWLLAKRPDERPSDAREVSALLAAGEESPWWRRRERMVGVRPLPLVNVRRDTALFGREEELARLQAAWRDAGAGRGGALLVVGEAGLGKSRLVDALVRAQDGDKAHVLYGSYPPGGGLDGLCDAITGHFGDARLPEALAAYLPPTLAPAFASLVRGEPHRLSDDGLHASLKALLQALAGDRPTLWIMEDLHFAPEVGRQAALYLARAAPSQRALVLLTSREPLPGVGCLELGRLPHAATAALVRNARPELPEYLREQIAAKADGVPYFAFELLRGLGDGTEQIAVPSAVRDAISARLRAITSEEHAILDVAAVEGFEFDADLVASVLEVPVMTVLQRLASLERRDGVVRAAGRRYRFDHHLIQEVVYADLPARLREEYHARLAEAFAARAASPGEAAPFLALHHLKGSRPREALPYLVAGLDDLERRHLHEAVLELTELALPLVDTRDRVRLLLRRAERLEILGRREQEVAAAQEAHALAVGLGDDALLARTRLAIGMLLISTSRDAEALEHLLAARELAAATGERRLETVARVRIGTALARVRRDAEALEELERGRQSAVEEGDAHNEALALGARGMALRHLGRYEEAMRAHEAAIRIARRLGERRLECFQEGALGLGCFHLGRLEDAAAHMRRQMRLGLEVGDRRAESGATGNLGVVLMEMGRLADAAGCFQRHQVLAVEIDDKRAAAVAIGNLGRLEAMLGEPGAAREQTLASLDIARAVGARHLIAGSLLALGHLARDAGAPEEARRHYAECLSIVRATGDPMGTAEALVALARLGDDAPARLAEARALAERYDLPGPRLQAAAVAGDAAEAARVLDAAADRIGVPGQLESHFLLWKATGGRAHLEEARRLLDLLSRHAPPERRAGLREGVPFHREILAATG